MSYRIRTASLSLSILLVGVTMSGLAAAEEHERSRAEPRSEGRPAAAARPPEGGRPMAGPRPGVGGRPAFDGHGQVLDQRYDHGRYYPPVGAVRSSLPGDYRPYYRGRDRYYFNGGIWYAPRGPGFIVVAPPPGLVISVLPPYYSTVWLGGNPYYYADNVYYTWQPDQNGYAVVDPPDGADQPSTPPDSPQSAQDDLIIYPKNGQSKDQQAADQFECHSWARNQTGFDPTQAGGGVQSGDVDRVRNNYNRAMSACLQGRGYQVN
ncbi:MAG TPA: DUF6515 family protein [Steroidobacteraceae bacterium]|jgi:hypothetical protein|nr:DUF6515 family protein [Steroidobacteraceae bacterium]